METKEEYRKKIKEFRERIQKEKECEHNTSGFCWTKENTEAMPTLLSDPPTYVYKCKSCEMKFYSEEVL